MREAAGGAVLMDAGAYLEKDLPDRLGRSLTAYLKALDRVKKGERYFQLDMDYCELQSDINVAEVEQMITPEQAKYLRSKYLYAE